MRICLSRDSLIPLLNAASNVAPKRSTRPVLCHVLLEADKTTQELTITANNDGALIYRGRTPASVTQEGSVCVRARDLKDLVRVLPAGDVVLYAGGQKVGDHTLAANGSLLPEDHDNQPSALYVEAAETSKYCLVALPGDQFPASDWETSGDKPVKFTAYQLKNALASVAYAQCTEVTRYYLNGVFFEQKEDSSTLNLVATDGHRLARTSITLGDKERIFASPDTTGAILSPELIGALLKLLDKADGQDEVRCHIPGKVAWFRIGDTLLQGILVEGSFPDYRQVLPSHQDWFTADRADLHAALTRVAKMSPDGSGGSRWQVEGEALTLSARHAGRGEGVEDLEIQPDKEGSLEAGYNAHFWADALKAVGPTWPRVMISYGDRLSPALLQPCSEENEATPNECHVVMPMRL